MASGDTKEVLQAIGRFAIIVVECFATLRFVAVGARGGNRRRVASSNYSPLPIKKKKWTNKSRNSKRTERNNDAQRTLVARLVGGRGGRPRANRSAFVSAATDTLAVRAVVTMAMTAENFISSCL